MTMWKQRLSMLMFCLLILPSGAAYADAKAIPATGKYVMGDMDSKSDAKRIALLNAKQTALEAAGTYLTSLSQVQNYELTNDEVSSLSAGIIAVEILDETWSMVGESPVVTITIQATVDPAGLEERIKAVQEDRESVEAYRDIRDELARLKAELADIKEREKAGQQQDTDRPKSEGPPTGSKKDTINRLLSIAQVQDTDAFIGGKRPEDAFSALSRAIELNPKNYHAHLKRAQIYESQKVFPKALADIDHALHLNPKAEKAFALKGRIFTKTGKLKASLDAFTKGIIVNPASGVCYFGRAVAYLQLKQVRKAYADFAKSCKLGVKEGCIKQRNMEQMKERAPARGKQRPARKRPRR